MAATYEQVIEALQKADAEGNVDDARQLAQMAVSLRPQGFGGGRGLVGGATAEGKARAATSMGEYLLESAKKGITTTPARMSAGQAMQQGTFAGAFPTQPELEPLTTENIQQKMGVDTNIRPATTAQKYFGAGVEGGTDITGFLGGGGYFTKGLNMLTGATSAIGGEFGGEVGKQIGGVPAQVLGGITFALLSGAGTVKGMESIVKKGVDRFNVKDLDVADMANVEGLSRAKDLVETALKTDPTLAAKLESVQNKIKFITGEKGALNVGGLDNLVIRTKLEDLAKNDIQFATELRDVYKSLQDSVKKKATALYPSPTGEIPSAQKKIQGVETDYNQRIDYINNQLNKLTESINLGTGIAPAEQGKAIQNLVLAKEKATRALLSPEYDSVLGQASKQGAILPAADTQNLLNIAQDLFEGDPWAKQAPLLKLVREQANKFKALRQSVSPAGTGDGLPVVGGADLSVGMDITSLDSLKRRVSDDIRNTRDPNRIDKLRQLQNEVDDALNRVQSSKGNVEIDFRGQKSTFGDAMTKLDQDYYNKVGVPFNDASAVQKIASQEYSEKIAPLIASSPTSLTQFLRISGEEGIPLAEKAVLSKLYARAIDPKTGYVDPVKLDSLITKSSNDGGFSDIISNLPSLKTKLQDVSTRSQYLSGEKVAIDDSAKQSRIDLGQSFLKDYDTGGVDTIINKMTGSSGKGYVNKFMVDMKKLSSEDQTNTKLAVRNALVTKMLDSENPFDYLNKNKDTFISMFGAKHFNNIDALADVARLSTKLDIEKLPIRANAVKETSAIERMMGGVTPQQITAIAVNQISSVFNKGFRILSLIGKSNLDEATKNAHKQLFMDEGGVDKILSASTKIISKKGKEVDLKDIIKPSDITDLASSIGMNVLRSGYLGGSTGVSPSEVMTPETQPYYIYQP